MLQVCSNNNFERLFFSISYAQVEPCSIETSKIYNRERTMLMHLSNGARPCDVVLVHRVYQSCPTVISVQKNSIFLYWKKTSLTSDPILMVDIFCSCLLRIFSIKKSSNINCISNNNLVCHILLLPLF
jgi:hypothetical protein